MFLVFQLIVTTVAQKGHTMYPSLIAKAVWTVLC